VSVEWPTIEDLGNLLALPFSDEENATAQRALDNARAAFQAEARHSIEFKQDHEIVIPGSWGSRISLPEPPVDGVSSIKINETLLSPAAYSWRRSGLVVYGSGLGATNDLSTPTSGWWGGDDAELTVVYSHGFKDIPDEVRTVVMEVAARVLGNPDGLIATLTEQELRIARRYRTWAMAA